MRDRLKSQLCKMPKINKTHGRPRGFVPIAAFDSSPTVRTAGGLNQGGSGLWDGVR
jgi:hypothetical protein